MVQTRVALGVVPGVVVGPSSGERVRASSIRHRADVKEIIKVSAERDAVVSRGGDTVFWMEDKVPVTSCEAAVPVRNAKDNGGESISKVRVERVERVVSVRNISVDTKDP